MSQPLSRRHFVHTLSAATVGLAAGATAAAKPREIQKAIMWSTIGVKGTVMEKMKAAQAAGFLGVEPMGAMNREDVVAALKETGLKAASVCCHTHWAKPLSAADEPTRKIGYDGLVLSCRTPKLTGLPPFCSSPAW